MECLTLLLSFTEVHCTRAWLGTHLTSPCYNSETRTKTSTLQRNLSATMAISDEKTLVETAFGLTQKGSVLWYQQPILPKTSFKMHHHPPYQPLPLGEYRLAPTECVHVFTEEEHLHLKSLMVTLDMVYKNETVTREQSADQGWHQLRKPRITSSRFRVCYVRGRAMQSPLQKESSKEQGRLQKWEEVQTWSLRRQWSTAGWKMSTTHPVALLFTLMPLG